MERLCFTFEIYPGTEAEYKKRHDEIWPELVEAIKGAGQSNYSLFRQGTTIVGYVECDPDVATALGKVAATDANARWQEWFKEVIVSLTDEHGELKRLEEVWHLD
jgi:L-rhamnose mutarotase